MTDATQHLDAAFIESKRLELTKLRDALRRTAAATELEEGSVRDAASEQSGGYEDDAQKLDTLEKEGLLVSRSLERLARIERALAKIDAGTYGFSEISGAKISKERLNAVPEAVNTIQEQERGERAG